MVEIIDVPHNMLDNWLYYETGFEQLHAKVEVIDWMASLGYDYGTDFRVIRYTWDDHAFGKGQRYAIEFPNSEIAALFITRWT
jgi:hypothetical protein